MQTLPTAALPFVIRREHGIVGSGQITSTSEKFFGLLRLFGNEIFSQWRTSREISPVGPEIRTDRELDPIREVSVPVSEEMLRALEDDDRLPELSAAEDQHDLLQASPPALTTTPRVKSRG